ncbi:MAG: MgtC/SapB family protein [Coprococcus sp.]|uniref:MgtC/SapB family protein n=1 Tax=Coprococcus catus TaxID=116085 RepID=UPI001C01CD52|nr:MgtC/SapB family protein [Coprococcus catus]MBT9774591.1 MgtC/SapB family protein [Coprococcus catus]MEE0140714.1 MgtC/SapB family protein [Coprococcus sp.]
MKGLQMIGSYLNEWNIVTITVRLILAVVCGGAIGLTRSVKRRGAGFKTHALVCLGSALVMMTGQYIYVDFGAISDIARLAAQVISGVGFLGVGTIMVTRDNHVKGLTTAAGLWTCAGIGLGIGIGFYSGAAITTILVLVIYRFMGRVDEIAYEHSRVLDIYIEFESRRSIAPFISVLKENNYKIMQMELNKSKKNKEELVNATLVLEVPEKTKHGIVIDLLREIPGIEYVEEI